VRLSAVKGSYCGLHLFQLLEEFSPRLRSPPEGICAGALASCQRYVSKWKSRPRPWIMRVNTRDTGGAVGWRFLHRIYTGHSRQAGAATRLVMCVWLRRWCV
jgi:hypothetical protein